MGVVASSLFWMHLNKSLVWLSVYLVLQACYLIGTQYPKKKWWGMLAVWEHFHLPARQLFTHNMSWDDCTKSMWKVMISSLNLLKTEVEMKQGKAGEASSLMITTPSLQDVCRLPHCQSIKLWGSMMMVRRRWKPVVEILGSTSGDVWQYFKAHFSWVCDDESLKPHWLMIRMFVTPHNIKGYVGYKTVEMSFFYL